MPINYSFIYGRGPCFIKIDKIRKLLYVANYGDGSIDIFLLNEYNHLEKLIYHKDYTSNSHIHYISLSSDNNFLFVVDLGDNKLFAYKIIFDGTNFNLEEFDCYRFSNNSNPRHLAISKENIYVITENTCKLYSLLFSSKTGFRLLEVISILGNNIIKKDNYTGCAIKISNDYKFIYTTIRGIDKIYVFKVNNTLELIQDISCFGKTPRDIFIDSSQNYLLCANQDSGTISIFNRNNKTGHLQFKSKYPIDSPACII